MIELTFNAKNMFFDRAAVISMIDAKELRAFNRIGGRIRQTAQRSMRKAPKGKPRKLKPGQVATRARSAKGAPPRRHGQLGEGLTKILYQYEPRKHRVIIGPVKFGWSEYPEFTLPQLHEFGGTVSITEVNVSFGTKPNWIRANRNSQKFKNRPTRVSKATYPARPFMYPALETNKTFIADAWAGARASVGG